MNIFLLPRRLLEFHRTNYRADYRWGNHTSHHTSLRMAHHMGQRADRVDYRFFYQSVPAQTPSPQPSPTRGEGVRASASCAIKALLVRKGSEQIHQGQPGPVSRSWWVLMALVVLLALPLISQAAPGGEERLRGYLKGLNTLSAEFRQYTLSADGGRMIESEGTLYLQRPGRFRWEYRAPLEQVIVADGSRVWLHDIELDQISHQSQASALDGTPAQLLASDEPIETHFQILAWDPGDGRDWVELQPRDPESQVTRIRIGFIGADLDTLLMEDSFGQLTRFSFLTSKRNPKLDAKLFRMEQPIGGDFLELR